ncbi:MAG TPA: CaiB/BaiF CoA-transferase family protein [Candidatus Binatia bacterium]|jgi:alpha-methylacyl-CoA racemase|nr:CaiB/BaiF CoA-transferase family protein [Candidatus Binatia bacterium]
MGPLSGIRIIELAGIGPGPFCAMLLADMGAEVLRVERTADAGLGIAKPVAFDLYNRSRRSIAVDLKTPAGVETILRLAEKADALIEGFRPGVTERLGLGPDACLARNARLVYGRMTGWGQTGPLSHAAGHDWNYIALSGALHAIGRAGDKPVPPLNLVGDFGGGSLYLALGIVAALLEASRSGKGQVVDAAITDGAASLMTLFYGLHGAGLWKDERGVNLIDTGAHFGEVYETSDGKYVTVLAIEPKFYAELCRRIGIDTTELPYQNDRSAWPELKPKFAALFKTKTRDEWCALLEGTDACFAPVLSLEEAPHHPHNVARETFVTVDGIVQPAPAPRFSRTPGAIQRPPAAPGEHNDEALAEWGFSADEIATLRTSGAIAP